MKHVCRSLTFAAALLLAALCGLFLPNSAQAQAAGTPDAKAGEASTTFIFRLRNANAANAAKFLTQVVGAWPAADAADAGKSPRQIVADPRTNSVLVIGFGGKDADTLRGLLGNLDTAFASSDKNAALERRLDQLERQVQSLLTDIQSLRQDLKTPQGEANGK